MIDLSMSELRTRALSARGPSDVDVMYTTCCHSTGNLRVWIFSAWACGSFDGVV